MKLSAASMLLLLIAFHTQVSSNEGATCRDLLEESSCRLMARHRFCRTNVRMKKLCRKTCKFCALERACKSKKCPFKHVCRIDDNDTPYCKCTVKCSAFDRKTGPVCAGNGKTYKTICMMKTDQCNKKKSIHIFHYGNCISKDSCTDFMPSLCTKFANKSFCKTSVHLMQFYCPSTCRLCRQPAPRPSCFESAYGCCWNKEKPATGPNQKGCGKCKEKSFCPAFKELCSDYNNIGIMRHSCPKTCGYC